VTGSGRTAITTTLATVNSNVGTFQGITVNAKGLVMAAVQPELCAPGVACLHWHLLSNPFTINTSDSSQIDGFATFVFGFSFQAQTFVLMALLGE
jgi:hypothetical protein